MRLTHTFYGSMTQNMRVQKGAKGREGDVRPQMGSNGVLTVSREERPM